MLFAKDYLPLPTDPELTWIDFGRDVQSNLSVEEVVYLPKQSELITLSLFVQPFVTSARRHTTVILQVKLFADQNETAIDKAVISVGPLASAQVAFTHQFKTSGSKVLRRNSNF